MLTKLRRYGYEDELNVIMKLEGFEQFAVKVAEERLKRRELQPAVCP